MATINQFKHRFYKNDGSLNVGGKVYTYVPGTSTLRNTYTDATAGTPNTNPIILDAKGEADIWQTGKIKVNVLQSDDTQVTGFPVDDIGYLVIGDEIHASPNKATPVDNDEIGIWNSISQVLNRVTFANLWAWIQSKLAAPGAIGGTTPAAITGTTITATTLNATTATITTANISSSANCYQASITTTIDTPVVRFPATQVPSSGANDLDDYEEGTWTPSLTFATVGNLSVAYSTRAGYYTKVGRKVTCNFWIVTSTFTHTTASGNLRVSGLPFNTGASTLCGAGGGCAFEGITKASYTQITPLTSTDGVAYFNLYASGTGQAIAIISSGDMPTGTSKALIGSITYFV